MKVKIAYIIQTVLFIIYIALTPLLVSENTRIFQDIKLTVIYSSIVLLFLVSIFFYHDFKEKYILLLRTFQVERQLIIVAVFMMIISLVINFNKMSSILADGIIDSNVFKGAGPNYLSIIFYWFSFIFIGTAIVSLKHTNNRLIAKSMVGSLILVGCIIFYQIFVNDFLGRGQYYLFGWGNSNYTPDPFSIVGLMLLIPLFYNDKINYIYLGIGIFFFEIVLLSASRGAYLGLFLSVIITSIVLFIKKKTSIKKIMILYGFAIVIFITSYILFTKLGFEKSIDDFSSMASLVENDGLDKYSLLNRFDLWEFSVNLFASSPYSIIFGSGQSVFLWDSSTTHYIVTNSHNQYIDTLLSGGVIVFIIFFVILYRQFMYAIRLVRFDINNIILLSALIFICVKWMFNSLNASHSPFVLLVFALISYRYMEMKSDETLLRE